jgi:hypothetical protein
MDAAVALGQTKINFHSPDELVPRGPDVRQDEES